MFKAYTIVIITVRLRKFPSIDYSAQNHMKHKRKKEMTQLQ